MPPRRTIEVLIQGQNKSQAAFAALNRDLARVPSVAAPASRALNGVMGAMALPGRALGGLTAGLGQLGLVALGIKAIADSAIGLTKALGLGLNKEMEDTETLFMSFTKSAEQTAEILRKVRREADMTPFEFPDMARAAATLIPSAKLADEALMSLLATAEILAAARPDQGLVGAAFSLREAVGGDFTSIIERFDLPRQRLNQLKAEGVPGLQAVRTVMQELGFDMDLVRRKAETLGGRWSTLMDTIGGVRLVLTKPLFDVIKTGLETLQARLDANKEGIMAWAESTGAAIGRFAERMFKALDSFSVHIPTILQALGVLGQAWMTIFGGMVQVAEQAGQLIYAALQWINPYARHSPSLVDQVKAGTTEIAGLFQNLPQTVIPYLAEMEAGLERLNERMGAGIRGEKAAESFGKVLAEQENALKRAEIALIPFERALERQQRLVARLAEAFRQAEADLRSFQEAPLAGERRFDDALFAASQAAARLRLEQLDMEERGIGGLTGPGRRGYANRRRQIEQELARLQRQQERLQLQRQITIDPQRRALQQIGQQPEVSFAEAMRGAQDAFRRIQELGPAFKVAEAATAEMEEELIGARDALRQQRDLLEPIRQKYAEITAQIRAAAAAAGTGPLGGGPLKIGGAPPGWPPRKGDRWWEETQLPINQPLAQFKTTVEGITTAVRFGQDALITFLGALRGDWTPGPGIDKLHEMAGNLGLALRGAGEIAKTALEGDIPGALDKLQTAFNIAWPKIEDQFGRFSTLWETKIKPAAEAAILQFTGWIGKQENLDKIERASESFIAPLLSFLRKTSVAFARGLLDMADDWGTEIDKPDVATELGKVGGKIARAIIKGFWAAFQDFDRQLTQDIGEMIREALNKITLPRWIPGQGWVQVPILEPGTPVPGDNLPPPNPTTGPPGTMPPPSRGYWPPEPPAYVPPPPPRGRLPAYQFGGAFMVGGQGGADSQWAGFWATPGEMVTITPPGEMQRGQVNVSIDFGGVTVRNDSDLRRLEAMIRELPARIEAMQDAGLAAAIGRGARRPHGLAYSSH